MSENRKKMSIKAITLAALFLSMIFFTGCWDNVEIENRGFVVSLGIDKANDDDNDLPFESNGIANNNKRFLVSMALPNIENIVAGGESDKQIIKTSAHETVSSAIKIVDSYSNEKLSFGQTRICVLGAQLLRDDALLKKSLDSLERNKDISRKMILLSTQDTAEEILSVETDENMPLGIFISNFYNNNSDNVSETFKLDMESFIRRLRADGNGIIPKVEINEGRIKLGGAAVIKNFKLKGWLDDEQIRGYLWVLGKAKGADLSAVYNQSYVPLSISENKTKIIISEEEEKLICRANIFAEGGIEEYTLDEDTTIFEDEVLQQLEVDYSKVIEDEVLNTYILLRDDFGVDAFDIKEHLRKFNYDLYLKYKDDWENVYSQMEMKPNVSVIIRNTGSMK